MSRQELNNSLKFQLSLLRLAVIPHASTPHNAPAADAALELVKLAEKVPASADRPTGV